MARRRNRSESASPDISIAAGAPILEPDVMAEELAEEIDNMIPTRGTFVDISELKKSEAARRESEERYRMLFTSIEEAFVIQEPVMDPDAGPVDYRYLECNAAFEKLLDLKCPVGKTMKEVMPDLEPEWLEKYNELLKTGEPARFQRHLPGLNRWIEAHAFRIGTAESWQLAIVYNDVTERKEAEEALLRSEERLRRVVNVETVGVVFFDTGGAITDANEAFLTMTGYSREDLESGLLRWDTMTAPEFMARAQEGIRELLANGKTAAYEKQYLRKDGTRWWGLFTAAKISAIEGVEYVIDISEHKQTQQEVEAGRRRLETVLAHMPIGVILHEAPSGAHLYHNEEATRLLGASIASESYRDFENSGAEHEDGRPYAAEEYPAARAILKGETVSQEEVIQRSKDGSARRLAASSAPIRNADGEIVSAVTALIDIEPRRAAEDALRGTEAELNASREWLRLIVENAREYAIISTDMDRRVTSWNSGAERLLGYTEPEIIGRSADVIFTDDDRAAGAPEDEASRARGEGRAADERWHVRKDGSRFWGSGVMMVMHDASGQAVGLVKIFRDQTEVRAASEALETSRQKLLTALEETERARTEAESAGRAKDDFLAILSHELRTPLTPVLMAVEMLEAEEGMEDWVHDSLEMIRRNIEIEAHLIDDLLDVTRISRGKLEISKEPVDLNEAVRRAIEISRPDIETKKQHLSVELKAGEHQISGDFNRLQQVFWNLVKNASKFTPCGGNIQICSRNEPGRLVVELSDSGIGIDSEALSRIFNPFEQGGETVARQFGGLGLGLAICKAVVEAHSGTLECSSDGHGCGAKFTVDLPLPATSADSSGLPQ